jgi:ABC-2 type transport system permease protein
MGQAFVGAGYIQEIIANEVNTFYQRYHQTDNAAVDIIIRNRFNPNLTQRWFGPIVELINYITMLSIILTGAALIRERERGTIEHLLVMPVTPFEIMTAKIWSMALVVLCAAFASLICIVQGALGVPIEGSIALFLLGTILHLFATTSMGIFLATMARNMPQFGMLIILILLPMQMLSGGNTPRESMPELVQNIMLLAPTTHFIEMGQAILFRGAGLTVVYTSYLALTVIGGVFFAISLARFRKTITRMA